MNAAIQVQDQTAHDDRRDSRTLPERLDLASSPAIETMRFYFRGHYAGCLTAVVDNDGVQLALIGRKGGHKGRAEASLRAMEREAGAVVADGGDD